MAEAHPLPDAEPVLPARAFQVTNMVCLGLLDRGSDTILSALALHGSFDPAAFTAWAVRPLSASATLSAFGNGKVIIAGARNKLDALLALEQLAYALSLQLGTQVNVARISVNNVVGSARLGYAVDLQRMYDENRACCRYRPDNFPGLQYSWYNDTQRRAQSRASDHSQNIAIVVFRTGCLVLTGAQRDANDLQHVFEESQAFIGQYRLPTGHPSAVATPDGARKRPKVLTTVR